MDPNLTIQFIEFTYCNDRFSPETLEAKNNKYKPLIDSIAARGWKVDPLIIITAGARATSHTPSMKSLENKFKIPMPIIKNTFKNINTIAIKICHVYPPTQKKNRKPPTTATNTRPPIDKAIKH
jgi:hypothetical protein